MREQRQIGRTSAGARRNPHRDSSEAAIAGPAAHDAGRTSVRLTAVRPGTGSAADHRPGVPDARLWVNVHSDSTKVPPARASRTGTCRVGSGAPAARHKAASNSAIGRGSPLVTTRAWPRASTQWSRAASSASTALTTYVLSIKAAPRADDRQPSTACPVHHSSHQHGVTWTPHQVWAYRDHGELAVIGAQRDQLGGGLASRVRPTSSDWIGGICAATDQRAAGMSHGGR